MNKNIIQRTVRFNKDQMDRLDMIAAGQGRSFADLLRSVVSQYLEDSSAQNSSHLRLARVSEYAQAALDTIILQDHPEHRDSILAETARRMERYHGSR